jgi:hypothetical protein
MIKVQNMTSGNGNIIANQFIITTDTTVYFQSYESIIAKKENGNVTLYKDWDYSNTTGKYRNLFLGETKVETLKKIKSGEYTLINEDITI